MRLGVVTDTQDMSGTVLSQTTELSVTEEELCTVVSSFCGRLYAGAANVFSTEGQWKETL